ncbi:3-phosphoshikimate 1-carboxyvinyltransferase [Caproiciproducens galactitolivorans]|uniref:3-phosphoshikimate 1-carboxyvinyltransferase n=1 Tax=Caproiciproducens galactitolivorans TaxID=642589 RepID=A0A4Z0Y0R4_9FIRM|nr:3-phosphoshikimate 1-carboxyvinyltransferase [Caproiciproducens galactitolivorans]QEY35606.1 3-phosphoshikimate 1-carboxyvinyltransferase [Caproiciproducens galactitolivorans]TGJ77334.1 3-phosphoshikimate 1-carboxyvinyltransferase [Caproiciproducens galactitolivorans]
MSDVRIEPSVLSGSILVPPSKSAAHRAVICSALAGGGNLFEDGVEYLSNDIRATIRAMKTLLSGTDGTPVQVYCGESGSTLRFLIPVAAALGIPAMFTGEGRLPQRPIGVYLDCLPQHGVKCETAGGLPLAIHGKLTPGKFILPGNVSSQFITGLLLALPVLDGGSEIRLSTPLESAGYVDMTIDILKDFGIKIEAEENGWIVPGNQSYSVPPYKPYKVERDWSQAAFFLAAGTLGGKIRLEGLNPDSRQGDRAAEMLFRSFGADIAWEGKQLTVTPKKRNGIEIDAAQIPDLVPVLAATAALCRGQTRIYNAQRLRIKESDRLAAMADGLTRLGGKVKETEDGLLIDGVKTLHGGEVNGCNDHRIVMAFAIAALKADGCVTIHDAQSVRKSYPDFFEDYNRLGGKAYVVRMG